MQRGGKFGLKCVVNPIIRERKGKMKKYLARELRSSTSITVLTTLIAIFLMACGSSVDRGLELQVEEAQLIASEISEGMLNQDNLIELRLSDSSKRLVVLEFGKLRDWNFSEANLNIAVAALFEKHYNAGSQNLSSPSILKNDKSIGVIQQSLGSCAQKVEEGYGTQGMSYVASIQNPSSGECGSDTDDKILIFNLYWGGADPDNACYWSNLWWVRGVLWTCYSLFRSPPGLSTNGLCGSTAHTCIGSCALDLGNDLYSVYLWHN